MADHCRYSIPGRTRRLPTHGSTGRARDHKPSHPTSTDILANTASRPSWPRMGPDWTGDFPAGCRSATTPPCSTDFTDTATQMAEKSVTENAELWTNVQAATCFVLLLDPLTKALIINFGGPATAGYFEMAIQVVYKVRALIVATNRAIVPHVTYLAETLPTRVNDLYRENVRILVYMTLPAITLLIVWASSFSSLLVGSREKELVLLINIIAITWASNIFSGPAFFTNMGTGHVGWNTISLAIMGALNLCLGWLFGSLYGWHGVIFAYAISVIIGSLALIQVFQKKNNLDWKNMLDREHLQLFVICTAMAVFSQTTQFATTSGTITYIAGTIILPLLVVGLAMWLHPLSRQLILRIKDPENH